MTSKLLTVMLLAGLASTTGCGSDNVSACEKLVESTKCGGKDAGDKLRCSSYASVECDITPYFDCMRSAYVCVNGHYDVQKLINASACASLSRCVSGGVTNPDLSTIGGPTLDFSTTGDNPDFSTGGPLDFSLAQSGDTCGDIIACANSCTTAACESSCIAQGSAAAQSAYNALGSCISSACPQTPVTTTTSSIPCAYNASTGAFLNSSACQTCISNAQMTGGSCASKLTACGAV